MKRHLHLVAVAAITGAIAAGAVQTLFSAFADQSERVPPTSGIYTGPQFSALLGDAIRSISTGNKGATAPANVGASAVDGLEWIDDSSSPWTKRRYVNGGWAIEGALDPSDSSYVGVIGGGTASIASGATTDLGAVPQANVTITGTTSISSFGSSAKTGVVKIVRFAGALTLTYSTALTVPGGYDLTTAANDRAIVTHLGSGNWEITQYTRASGIPIDVSAVGKYDFTSSEAVPPLHVAGYGQPLTRASYPAYFAKATRAQNGTRTSGNATITGIASIVGLGVGMPVESTGVNAGCTIASVGSTSITLNSSACVTASGTSTVTVFLYGYGTGGSATTVGVPDCRGRTLAGRDRNDLGPLADRLTTSYFGADSGVYGAIGGNEKQTVAQTQLPNISPSFTGTPNQGITVASNTLRIVQGDTVGTSAFTFSSGGSSSVIGVNFAANGVNSTGTFTATGTVSSINGGVTQSALTTTPPILIAECVVRVTP